MMLTFFVMTVNLTLFEALQMMRKALCERPCGCIEVGCLLE